MYVVLRENKKMKINILGEGEPIIFVHSYLWDKNMWQPQLEELSKYFKCISIDLWGHGESDILNEKDCYSLASLSKDIIDVAKSLNISKFNYVGLSVGAMIGTYLALNYKESINKLVLMDGYSGIEPKETQSKYFLMLNSIEELGYIPEELTNIIAPIFFTKKEVINNGELYRNFKKELLNKENIKIKTIVNLGKGIFGREDILDKMEEIKNEILFMVGDEDIPRPQEESLKMHKLVKNSKFIIIPNAGHISNLENPIFVNKQLLKFLSNI
ncbi:MAG: alpha/beta fold hydrolase [Cetobacterium sp.]|uniref:alpha/beta fold hydrolase n=1 Tax=Cetobacterium sp. TaxID=2071632 RepID=UPI003F35F925